MLAGLDRADALAPGAGVLDLGSVLDPSSWTLQAEARAGLRPGWSAYGRAWAEAPWAAPFQPDFGVGVGLRFRW